MCQLLSVLFRRNTEWFTRNVPNTSFLSNMSRRPGGSLSSLEGGLEKGIGVGNKGQKKKKRNLPPPMRLPPPVSNQRHLRVEPPRALNAVVPSHGGQFLGRFRVFVQSQVTVVEDVRFYLVKVADRSRRLKLACFTCLFLSF